ncbi:MAG: thioredoxin domain-containing protein [Nocardioidaceae bacterium]|nr:thioredoxin domain-containing protein [Nocardioidaceae bacterium]
MTKKKSNATRRAEQLAAAERAAAIRLEQERQEKRRRVYVVIGVVLVLVLLLGLGYAVQSSRDTTGQVATPPTGVVDEYAVPRGATAAPVTVTIFEDFMCPFCGDFETASRELLEQYVDDGDVLVEYRVVSFLDGASDGSDYSTRAMNALGVVLDTAGQDAAVRFHDVLFDEQPEEGTEGLSDDDLIRLAVQAGASEADVTSPIRDRKFEQWVENATDEASQGEVNQTPTVLVDGEVMEFETIEDLVGRLEATIEAGVSS